MPMQPRPMAETSRLLFPSLRFCILLLFTYGRLVVFPGHAPVFVRICGIHEQLVSREFVGTWMILADETAHHGAFDMKNESVRVLVDLIGAKRGFVTALRILNPAGLHGGLRVAVHHLDRHVAVAGVDEQPRAIRPVNRSGFVRLFYPYKPPSPDKPVLDLLLRGALCRAGML